MTSKLHQKLLGSLSLRSRFLLAPIVAVFLSLILYFSSDSIIASHGKLFKQLSDTNLVQISEISQITILLTENNNDVVALLFQSERLDEEAIAEEGQEYIDRILDIEERLKESLSDSKSLIINNEDIFAKIRGAFASYRSEVISAIEMHSVDKQQAAYELVLANNKLKKLSHFFFTLSEYYTNELGQQSEVVKGTLYKKTYITELTILLIALMLWAAYYFSESTAIGLTNVYNALGKLAKGDTSIKIEANNDQYIENIWRAVGEFKESIINSEAYKNELLIQKFAMDQHAIIAVTDIEGTILYANPKFCETSGYSEQELVGSNHRIVNSGNQPKSYWKNMYETVSSGQVWQDEVLNRAKDGRTYWVDSTIIPMTAVHDKNKVTGYLAIRTDITEKKLQHQELVEANAVAESAVVAKSQFLATMSHEIRTPMNGVLGMLDLILNNELSIEQRKHAEVAYNSAQSLLTLIDDILDFSKIDANKLELELINFDLLSMLEEFTECMRFQAEDKGLALVLDTTDIYEPTVIGDPGRLRQILTNIVGNAIKFTAKGDVTIYTKLTPINNDELSFICSVTDTGIGIKEEQLSRLFTSFSQVDLSTTRKYGGTGLGLAISKRLAQLMHGDITVTSSCGQGSCFTCTIKLGICKKEKEPTEIEPTPNQTVEYDEIPTWAESTRILLVEDNRVNQLVAKGVLKRFGLIGEVANNGVEALTKLHQSEGKPYSLILMDCQMPEMDGYQATQEIRAHQDQAFDTGTPIIAMTANAMKGDREKCINAGMDDYLTKPIDPALLLDKLKYWLK